MALSKDEELELIDLEIAIKEKEQAETPAPEETVNPRIAEQQKIVDELKATNIDPQTIAAQEHKLKMLKDGVPNEDQGFLYQDKPFDTTGENIAKGLAEKGFNPHLAAAAGTLFSMLPEIAEGAASFGGTKVAAKGGKAVVKAVANTEIGSALRGTGKKAVGEISEALAEKELTQTLKMDKLKTAAETMGEMASKTKEEVVRAAEAPISKIKQTIADLPMKQQRLREGAQAVKEGAKKAIGEAEEALGIGLKDIGGDINRIIDNPRRLTQFASKASKIADKGAEFVAESMDLKTIQTMRKAASEGFKKGGAINDLTKSELAKTAKVMRDALGLKNKGLSDAFARYGDAEKVIQGLPQQFKAEKAIFQSGLNRAKELAKDKVMTDAKLKRLNQITTLLERKAKELPRQFDAEKKALHVALQKARNLAEKQATTRKMVGGGVLSAALGGAGAYFGRKIAGQ